MKAICQLKKEGIRRCTTAMLCTLETAAAGRAGVDHGASFIGCMGKADEDPMDRFIASFREPDDRNAIRSNVMAAARGAFYRVRSFVSGADAITGPEKDLGSREFLHVGLAESVR